MSEARFIPALTPADRQQQENYFTVYHGKATDTLARMNTRNVGYDMMNNAIVEVDEVKAIIQKFNELNGTLGVNTHKLLIVGISNFTALNNYDRNGEDSLKYRVDIPLKEYASSLGYDVYEHEGEDATKEKKRAKTALDNARKAIKKDLDILHATALSWEEKVKGKQGDFDRVSIVSRTGIRDGRIFMEFGVSMAEYLAKLPLTLFPIALLRIDARNPNAYNIGLQMWLHFNNDNNQIRGTANRLKVATLLSYTELPSIEKLKEARLSWESRIKEPLESALDTLTLTGVISDWKYTYAKGVDLTDEEAENITDFYDFTELYITYELKNAPDHRERLAIRAKEKKARATKAYKKKPTTEQ